MRSSGTFVRMTEMRVWLVDVAAVWEEVLAYTLMLFQEMLTSNMISD